MKFLHGNATETFSWKIYRELELIPVSVSDPRTNKPTFTFGLDRMWRLLIIKLTQELVYYDQQVEYLERCWTVEQFEPDGNTDSNTLQRLWRLMN